MSNELYRRFGTVQADNFIDADGAAVGGGDPPASDVGLDNQSVVIGNTTDPGDGTDNVVIGESATIDNDASDSVAVGSGATVNNASGTVVGAGASGGGTSAVLGQAASASDDAVAIGAEAATTDDGVSIGYSSSAEDGVSVGTQADTVGDSVAVGRGANTSASGGVALGPSAQATGSDGIAIGASVSAAANRTVIGKTGTIATFGGSFAVEVVGSAPVADPGMSGVIRFCTGDNKLYVWNGSAWKSVALS